jgi:hypothetical protein
MQAKEWDVKIDGAKDAMSECPVVVGRIRREKYELGSHKAAHGMPEEDDVRIERFVGREPWAC